MNGGTRTTRPVSVVAGLVTELAVAERMHDRHFDRGRQLDAYGLPVVEADLDEEVGGEVVHGVAERIAFEGGLLIGVLVHEVVVFAVVVEELHLDGLDVDTVDGVGRAEALGVHRAGADVLQLGLDEGAQVAGRAVLDGEDEVQVVFEFDDHAGAHLCGGDRQVELLAVVELGADEGQPNPLIVAEAEQRVESRA
jgi:hypothetical protein